MRLFFLFKEFFLYSVAFRDVISRADVTDIDNLIAAQSRSPIFDYAPMLISRARSAE